MLRGTWKHERLSPRFAPVLSKRKALIEIPSIHRNSKPHLFFVVQTNHLVCLQFCFPKGRQEHARKNGNNGNDHQQFDQGECLSGCLHGMLLIKRVPLNSYKKCQQME